MITQVRCRRCKGIIASRVRLQVYGWGPATWATIWHHFRYCNRSRKLGRQHCQLNAKLDSLTREQLNSVRLMAIVD